MKSIDALSLTEREERPGEPDRHFRSVKPGDAYPKTIAHIRERIANAAPPDRYISVGGSIRENPLLTLYGRALEVPAQSWDHALEPGDNYPPKARANRAEALEVARLWFTEELHQKLDYAPMGLHILRDERYKL